MPTGVLTSARAPRVAAARRLAKRSFRAADRRFLVEGPQAASEALAEAGAVTEVFVVPSPGPRIDALGELARAAGLPVHVVTSDVMASLAQTVTPQGIVAVAHFRDVALADIAGRNPRLVVLLAAVRDPGNAGTVVRAADAAGADAVVFCDSSVDPYNGKCVRASAGSLFHLPFALDVPVAHATGALREAGARVLAATGAGAVDIDVLDDRGGLAGPTAWLFGNEAWGLPDDVVALADDTVRVPIYGRAESLNLGTAAAVCLYASARAQRRTPGSRRDDSPEKT